MPTRRVLLLLVALSAVRAQLPPFPGARISDPASGPVGYAQQVSTAIELNAPYPVDIQGQAILSFTPDSGTFDDPFIQFSTGGRAVNFVIPPGMGRRPLPVFQTGTLAGTITLTVRLLAQGMELPAPAPRVFVLPHLPPSIRGGPCVTATASGFNLSASGFTTNRNLVSAQITILPAPGDPQPPRVFDIDLRAAAAAFFQSPASAPFGGQFQLNIPFTTSDGSLPAALFMRISNLEGPASREGTSGSYRDRCLASTQTGLTFDASASSGTVSAQTFRLAPSPSLLTRVPFSATASTFPEGLSWLSVSPAQGVLDSSGTGTSITVSARPDGLASGVYYGLVQVVSNLPNSPQFVTVVLNVASSGQSRPPVVMPTGLLFAGEEGGPVPGEQSVRIVNGTGSDLTFSTTLSADGSAFSVTPTSGIVAASQSTDLTVRANLANLAPGEYRGQLLIRFPGDGSTQAVELLLLVTPRGPQAPSAARLAAGDRQAGCIPARLLPVFSLLSSGYRTRVAAPTPIETIVLDDCGRAFETGRVAVTFSNGDSPLELTTLGDGRWSATWSPQNARTESTIATVTAEDLDRGIRGSAAIGGTVQADLEAPPSIGSGGVVSAASLLPGASPGGIRD